MTKTTPYQFAIVGPSGRGKTMSFRNMNPDTCGFINMEGKPLPFMNNFKHYSTPNNWQECYQKLIEYAKNDEITEVVLDSFSAYSQSLLKTARETKKNFDVWNLYNEEVGKLLYLIKKYPKDIIISGHSQNYEGEEGINERRIAVQGKEWNKTGIEAAFNIVLFTEIRRDVVNKKTEYLFNWNSDGITTGKTPPMFLEENEETIENDSQKVLERIRTKLSNG